jgi:hypothetical protein
MTANLILTSDVETGSDSGNWTANITSGNAPDGVGGYTGAFTFSGTASGTWSGALVGTSHQGTIGGTADGVVPSVLTQDPVEAPNTVVGSIPSLSGSYNAGALDVTLSNVKFYASSSTAKPQIWQATSVSGSFTGGNLTTYINQPVTVTNGANSAVFSIYSSDGSNWRASVTNGTAPSGVGTYPSPLTFSGSAYGTNTSTTLTGGASGKVQ